jgi:serine/threonine-protein kinase
VSPHNIILGYDGTVKLLDFGVAMSAVTEHGDKAMIVGKWLYMSPEATSSEPIDHRSDLFSLGVIMYLLCSGSMPFIGTDPKELIRKIRGGIYKPLEQLAPDLPEGLAALVTSLLSPSADDRPQTGQEVVATLTTITRRYGIESSAANLARLVTELFTDEAVAPTETLENEATEIMQAGDKTRIGLGTPAELAYAATAAKVPAPVEVSVPTLAVEPIPSSPPPIAAPEPIADNHAIGSAKPGVGKAALIVVGIVMLIVVVYLVSRGG